jgi:hypothetical protein
VATADKDFKVKNGLVVGAGGTFNGTVVVATPTDDTHAATKQYVDENAGGGGGGYTVSDTPPSNPSEGDSWFDSSTGRTFVYYDGYWVESGTSSSFPNVVTPLSYDLETNTVSVDLSSKQDIVAGVSGTEIGYLDGVTSGIQSQIDSKASLSGASFTGNILTTGTVSGTPSAATNATSASSIGYMGIPISGTAGNAGNVTLGSDSAGELILTSVSRTVTIPSNASSPLQNGTAFVFISEAGATTTIAIDSDTLILAGDGSTGTRTLDPHGMATAVKVASTVWYISGNGLS